MAVNVTVLASTLSVFNLLGCNCQNRKCEAGDINCNDGNYQNGSIIVLSQRDVGRGELQASHVNSHFSIVVPCMLSPKTSKVKTM